MNDNQLPVPNGWFSNLVEGGLPQIIAGPAGKAISRLIGSAVEIPAAYLDGVAQGIRDKSEAKTYILKRISEKAADFAANDPDVIERALDNMMAGAYRKQKNKDSIAQIAIEEMQDNPPPSDSKGPSEDWLNKFERYAEDASSESVRLMFGRLLAGEIREPGRVSPATMHLVSMLDTNTAKLIERILPFYAIDGIALVGCINPTLTISEEAAAEQAGIFSSEKTFNMDIGDNGYAIISVGVDGKGMAVKGNPGERIEIPAAIMSGPGKDLASIIRKDFDYKSFSSYIKKNKKDASVYVGDFTLEDQRSHLRSVVEIQ